MVTENIPAAGLAPIDNHSEFMPHFDINHTGAGL
jgi:hypothetical protein